MFAVKSHESPTIEAKAAGREPVKRADAQSSQLRPLWHKFATALNASPGSTVQSMPPAVQAKLVVSRPDDSYEQEADRVADLVMRAPEPEIPHRPT